MGHIGFTPQFKDKFKVEGKKKHEIKKLVRESLLIEKAGAFSIVLECITPNASKIITNLLKIPTIPHMNNLQQFFLISIRKKNKLKFKLYSKKMY